MRLLFVLALLACSSPQSKPIGPAGSGSAVAKPSQPKVVDDNAPTPLDPQITRGTLPSGLTYYVMPHKKPEQRAALWLAVNAGSILEDDDQRGLAHFVEHMAFNGTKRFAKQAIVDYIERIGMQFGADVNAGTGFDETIYQLTVPTDDPALLSTGLDILRDWAGDITFDATEVEKERGVVLEEWRLGRGASARIADKEAPIMFQGSKYAVRDTIGLPEILKKAPRDALVRFYKDWYRPEHMAVIAVGDFDAAAIQKLIAAKFADLKSTSKRSRADSPVPHAHPTAIAINTDPEMPYTSVQVVDKLDHRPEASRADYRRFLVDNIFNRMIGARLAEIGMDPGAPFLDASSSSSDLTRTADAFIRSATAKQGRAGEALGVLFREIARVEQHGFLATELERARREELVGAETSSAEWDKTPSDSIADEMTRHFLTGEQMPGRPVELQYHRDLLPTITLAELDRLAKSTGQTGRVITIAGPANTTLPTEDEVRKIVATAEAAKVDAWVDTPVKPLLAKLPTPGKITATAVDPAAGATIWTLSNGIRVAVRPTKFQNDSVDIRGFKPGGTSLLDDLIAARFADDIVARMGAGELDPIALRKALAGKIAEASVGFSEISETASATARPADLETALQLLHLKMTAPRRDERLFAAWKAEQTEFVRNRRLSPEGVFFDDMNAINYGNHPRYQPTTPELVGKADLDKAIAAWRSRMADLGGFTFIVVGNVDLKTLAPLVERYLGSLPSAGKKETWKDIGIKYPTGQREKTVIAGTEPKASVSMTFSAPDAWSRDGVRDVSVLSQVLSIRLREVLREDLGGVYGVGAYGFVSRIAPQRRRFAISFGCDPDNVVKLRAATVEVVRAIQKSGIGDEYLAKVREQLKREHETDTKENWWWSSKLYTMLWFGDSFADVDDYAATLARVTSANVQAAAKRFLDDKNLIIGVLRPAITRKK